MSLSPLLQIRAMVRSGSSAGVSLGYLGVLTVGFTLWLAYGVSLGNPALVVTNIVSLGVGIATMLVATATATASDRRTKGSLSLR